MAEDVTLASDLKSSFGLSLQPTWVAMCVEALRANHPDAAAWTAQHLKEQVLAQALHSDLRTAGAACLPDNLQVGPAQHAFLLHTACRCTAA